MQQILEEYGLSLLEMIAVVAILTMAAGYISEAGMFSKIAAAYLQMICG